MDTHTPKKKQGSYKIPEKIKQDGIGLKTDTWSVTSNWRSRPNPHTNEYLTFDTKANYTLEQRRKKTTTSTNAGQTG